MIRATIRMTPVITQKNNLQNMVCKMFDIPYFAFSKLFEFFLKKGLQFRKRCGIITKPSDETANRIVGVDYNEGPPVPIPNTEVKLVCAENTRLATARDDRLAPTLRRITEMWFFFYFSKAISSLCQRELFHLRLLLAVRAESLSKILFLQQVLLHDLPYSAKQREKMFSAET